MQGKMFLVWSTLYFYSLVYFKYQRVARRTTPEFRDGVLEDCPRPRGHLEDKKSWPWPRQGLALASTPCPLESGLHSPVTCSLSIITAVA